MRRVESYTFHLQLEVLFLVFLCISYGRFLLNKSPKEAAPYMIASGLSEEFVKSITETDFQNSFILACNCDEKNVAQSIISKFKDYNFFFSKKLHQ
jgi:hypothetical protein